MGTVELAAERHKARGALTLSMTGVSAAVVVDVLIGHELARRGVCLPDEAHRELVGMIAGMVDDELRALELAARPALARPASSLDDLEGGGGFGRVVQGPRGEGGRDERRDVPGRPPAAPRPPVTDGALDGGACGLVQGLGRH